jgi:hypothetical protein
VQKIAIQENVAAFRKSHAVSRVIEESIVDKVKRRNLSFYLEPLYNKQEFWDLINRYQKRVTQVSFELISPNLANISKNLKLNLKQRYEEHPIPIKRN